jgi:protein-L-isoaspartate(D-aspartate) O-methyltransferase
MPGNVEGSMLFPKKDPMNYQEERDWMVRTQIENRGIMNSRLLQAMRIVPRHEFVPESLRELAYQDGPVSIGYGQTISQPYIVALMIESLEIREASRVLDVGTGSGYQTALLAELGATVFTVELEPSLAERARETLDRLGYGNIKARIANGSLGWPEFAPYDSIIAAASAPEVPESLLSQLSKGGKLVIPLGSADYQNLWLFERKEKSYRKVRICRCSFVPLMGTEGWGASGFEN